MDEKIKQQSLEKLKINNKIVTVLEENRISSLGDLCQKSKTDLKNIGLEQVETNKIEIELQLIGLNLKNSL